MIHEEWDDGKRSQDGGVSLVYSHKPFRASTGMYAAKRSQDGEVSLIV